MWAVSTALKTGDIQIYSDLTYSVIEEVFPALDFEQKAFANKQCAIPLPWLRLAMFYNFRANSVTCLLH